MFVWGTKTREINEELGEFNCPSCECSQPYKLVRHGRYLTVFWLPIFQYRIIQKYVECAKCKSTYEEEVKFYNPPVQRDAVTNTSETHSMLSIPDVIELNEDLFKTFTEMPHRDISMHIIMFEDRLTNLSAEQRMEFLAFELGVLDYYYRAFVEHSIIGDCDALNKYYSYLSAYAKLRFENSSEDKLMVWVGMNNEKMFLRERELGYESLRSGVDDEGNRVAGYFPGAYFLDAVLKDKAA